MGEDDDIYIYLYIFLFIYFYSHHLLLMCPAAKVARCWERGGKRVVGDEEWL